MFINNKISVSKVTLPLSVAYFVVAFLCAGMLEQGLWITALSVLISAWLVEMLNIRNVLIRGYSRLTACFFLLLSLVTIRILPSFYGAITLILFILYLFFIFQGYQERYAPSLFFFAHIFIGIISVEFVQILFFVPFLWLMIIVWLQASSVKNFLASFLGILLPYCFWATYLLYSREPEVFVNHFTELVSFDPVCNGLFELHLMVATAILIVLNVWGIVHYLRFSYNESIKNRMLHYMIFTISILTFMFLILQPQHKEYLLRIAILTTSISMAHYFTFAKDKVTHYLFIILLLLLFVATVVAIWNF